MISRPPALVGQAPARSRTGRDGEAGSLILDILIGMAVFALVSVIAVSGVSQYRERTFKAGAVSDANALGQALEARFTKAWDYPADQTALAVMLAEGGSLDGVVVSQNFAVEFYLRSDDSESFAVCVEHGSDGDPNAWAVYNSAQGGLAGSGRSVGCAAAQAANAAIFEPVFREDAPAPWTRRRPPPQHPNPRRRRRP